ncbi:Hint domain-containing protein [Paracoccus onubensis]|uniref:Hedgehog/Intein (Hint) domain-containing protein n=1 Tax=Paracoccus onubensis TaxID=1675788 RepID=A0A418SP93_9RHOB|nr:Hint domain-containing protein [Paracoccus onubensis]RJE82742.1 hypothetical protein D3P04_18895 [Paracoccus onubensis]
MATWTDNPDSGSNAQDHNPNADNYWVFTTDQTITANETTSQLQGYSFDPLASYNTNVALRDGNEDGALAARNWGNFHTNDGITVDGHTYEYSRHWTYEATITYSDGTSVDTTILASRLVDDPDNGTAGGALDGRAILRFHDDQISTVYGGASGTGEYALSDIESITLGANLGNAGGRSITGAYNNAYPVVCFATGTLIETANGTEAVETLQSGDAVLTRDNDLQPIRWIGSRKLSAQDLAAAPQLRPIRIKAGSLGANTPASDLIVSPQHRVLVRSKIAQRMFGTEEVLVAAKQLLEIEGIDVAEDIHEVEYFHFMFDRHEIVFSNGAETESLYTGPVALRSVSPESRKEILSLFPELAEEGFVAQPVRLLASGRQGRRLAYRHVMNRQEMVY